LLQEVIAFGFGLELDFGRSSLRGRKWPEMGGKRKIIVLNFQETVARTLLGITGIKTFKI